MLGLPFFKRSILIAVIILALASSGIAIDLDHCQPTNVSNSVYYLTSDLSNSKTCIAWSAKNSELNCMGHSIAAKMGVQFMAAGLAGKVYNCTFLSPNATALDVVGIYTQSGGNVTHHLEIYNNLFNFSCGQLRGSINFEGQTYFIDVYDNNFLLNSLFQGSYGVKFTFGIHNSTFRRNNFTAVMNSSQVIGGYTSAGSYTDEYNDNNITLSGLTSYAFYQADKESTYHRNNIFIQNCSQCSAIHKAGSSTTTADFNFRNSYINNTIFLNSSCGECSGSAYPAGIELVDEYDSNITGNIITTYGEATPIYIYTNYKAMVYNNSIFNNVFNYSSPVAIAVYSYSSTPPQKATSNYFNVEPIGGVNIVGGSGIAGNFYDNSTPGSPYRFSVNCTDANLDGFCDTTKIFNCTGTFKSLCTNNLLNIDYFPLMNVSAGAPPPAGNVTFYSLSNNGSSTTNFYEVVGWFANIFTSTATLDNCWFSHNLSGVWVNSTKVSCGSNNVDFSVGVQMTSVKGNICGQFGANTSDAQNFWSALSCFSPAQGTLTVYPIDEGSEASITDALNITLRSEDYINSTILSGGTDTYNLFSNAYSVDLGNNAYPKRRFYITVNSNANSVLYAPLLSNASSTTHYITIYVRSQSNALLTGVSVQVMKQSGGSFITVEQRVTDVFGSVRLFVDSATEYKLIFTASGYQMKEITSFLTDTSSTVYLVSSVTPNSLWNLVNYNIIQQACTNFSMTASSPSGAISGFGVQVEVNGTTYEYTNYVSPSGGTAELLNMNFSNFSVVNSHYFIESPSFATINISRVCGPGAYAEAVPGSLGSVVSTSIIPELSPALRYVITSVVAICVALAASEFMGGMFPAVAGTLVIIAAGILGFISIFVASVIGVLMFLTFFVLGRGGGD